MKNVIVGAKVILEDKSMVTENGEKIDYVDTVVEINGVPIHVTVKKQDKGLLAFLRAQSAKESAR